MSCAVNHGPCHRRLWALERQWPEPGYTVCVKYTLSKTWEEMRM